LERYFSRNGDVYLFFGKRGIIHKNKMVLNQTGVANNMSDRALLVEFLLFIKNFIPNITDKQCKKILKNKEEEIRTRMAALCPHGQWIFHCNESNDDFDEPCTLTDMNDSETCCKCEDEEKKDGI
jgi:hypothetical protein